MNSTGQSGGNQARRLPELLKGLRRQKGITIVQMARILHVDQKTVIRIEQGKREIRLVAFRQWCDAVGTPSYRVLKFIETTQTGSEPEKTL